LVSEFPASRVSSGDVLEVNLLKTQLP